MGRANSKFFSQGRWSSVTVPVVLTHLHSFYCFEDNFGNILKGERFSLPMLEIYKYSKVPMARAPRDQRNYLKNIIAVGTKFILGGVGAAH